MILASIDLPLAIGVSDIDADALFAGVMVAVPLFLFFVGVGLALGWLVSFRRPVVRASRKHFGGV